MIMIKSLILETQRLIRPLIEGDGGCLSIGG